MKQQVEPLVSVPNGYLYRCRVSEMGENAKRQDGSNKTLSILILKSIKQRLIIFFNTIVVGKYDDACEEYRLFCLLD